MGHAHHGVVNCDVAVGVVFCEYFPNNGGGFSEAGAGAEADFVHGVENAAVNGFHPIADIRKRTGNDDAHGVFEIGGFHFRGNALAVDIRGVGEKVVLGLFDWFFFWFFLWFFLVAQGFKGYLSIDL